MWLTTTLLVVLGTAAVLVSALLYGRIRWERETAALVGELEEARSPVAREAYESGDLDGLPPPVARYLRAVLEEGQPKVAVAEIRHTGRFDMGTGRERWVPFRSYQFVTTSRPGFVWDARMALAPGLGVYVHDAYVTGRGQLRARLMGLVTVMEQPQTQELAQGELMRFLAEAAWYPTALLPGRGVRWEPIDERSASATLTDAGISVTLTFEFDGQGLIRRVGTDERPRVVDGETVSAAWWGRFWNYERREGILIPLDGEVSWLLPEGAAPYWRGTIEEITYRFGG